MIFLNPEFRSLYGDDDFWTWFRANCTDSRFMDEGTPGDDDVVLQYAVLGPWRGKGRYVALLWELYPQMIERGLHSEADYGKVELMNECAAGAWKRTAPSPLAASYFHAYGPIDIMPIGVDTDLFRPVKTFRNLNRAYWCGSSHPMKGYDLLGPELDHRGLACRAFFKESPVSQQELAEEMKKCDWWIRTSRLPSFYLSEWEAMAAGLPMILAEGAVEPEFKPMGRDGVIAAGWSRDISKWIRYLEVR